jgi:hypothetical protein
MEKKSYFCVFLLVCGMLFSSFALVTADIARGQKADATMSLTYISYASLTAKCLAAGLSSNPYPAPTVPETFTVPGNPDISQIRDQSQYYTLSLTIDGQQYSGVVSFVYNGMSDKDTGLTIHHFDGVYYVGATGDLSSGFSGMLQMKLYGRVGTTIDHGTVHCLLQGFGDYSQQELDLANEVTLYANIFKGMNGYCNKA